MTQSQNAAPTADAPLRYWVCSTQRSGSTLLCDLLAQTGAHGAPEEFFDTRKAVFRDLYDAAGGTREQYLAWLVAHRSSPNGAFGVKLHWNQGVGFMRGARADLMAHARLGTGAAAVRKLASKFDGLRYVWVRREDRVGQAVSLYRARNTNQWVRPDGDTNARRPDPAFDADEIARALRWLTRVDTGWQRYFGRVGAPAHVVHYERLAADPSAVLGDLGTHLGVPITAQLAPRLERQRDDWSTEMRERYIEARGVPAELTS